MNLRRIVWNYEAPDRPSFHPNPLDLACMWQQSSSLSPAVMVSTLAIQALLLTSIAILLCPWRPRHHLHSHDSQLCPTKILRHYLLYLCCKKKKRKNTPKQNPTNSSKIFTKCLGLRSYLPSFNIRMIYLGMGKNRILK